MANVDKKFGTIEFSGKDIATAASPFDRIAVTGRSELLLVSLIAPTQTVKQIRAILNTNIKVSIMAGGVRVSQPGASSYQSTTIGKLSPGASGYTCHTHKLEFGQCHAMFISKASGFMKIITGESLWQELNNVRFTTPILRDWISYIEAELRNSELLEDAHVHNCRCGVLSATTDGLDEIVSAGLRDRSISIPRI